MDDISSAFGGMNFQDAGADAAATSQGTKLTMSRRRTPRGGERIRAFNPRAPNFLPVAPDPDAEKVDLRHQMTDDRKNAEEWMVDYALRRTVNKLARAQKRKVEMLVQAFETVLPPVLGENKSDDKKSFACNCWGVTMQNRRDRMPCQVRRDRRRIFKCSTIRSRVFLVRTKKKKSCPEGGMLMLSLICSNHTNRL